MKLVLIFSLEISFSAVKPSRIAGILTTIYQYLKISELNESNRVAYLSWGKFYRDVKTELSKHPLDRMRPKELLKLSKKVSEADVTVFINGPTGTGKECFQDLYIRTQKEVINLL